MRSAFRATWWTSAACAFVLLTACSQGVSADVPAGDPTATQSPSDGLVRYQDPEGHFAVSYPAGWNVDDNGPAAAFTPGAPHSYVPSLGLPRIVVSALRFTTEPQ
jgi:hypothetical protein